MKETDRKRDRRQKGRGQRDGRVGERETAERGGEQGKKKKQHNRKKKENENE